MWLLAMSLSTQFEHLRDGLYSETRTALEALDLSEDGDTAANNLPPVQVVQAWILLALYEYQRKSAQCAWLSAGRAFRLVHLLRLHEIDSVGLGVSPPLSVIRRCKRARSLANHRLQQVTPSDTSASSSDGGYLPMDDDWITMEEKRRTFWVAYVLDRLCSTKFIWPYPLTLQEDVVCQNPTRHFDPLSNVDYANNSNLLRH